MKTTSAGRWCFTLMMRVSFAYSHYSLFQSRYPTVRQGQHFPHFPQQSFDFPRSSNFIRRRAGFALEISTIDVDVPDERERRNKNSRKNKHQQQRHQSDGSIISWNDLLPLSMYAAACLVGAMAISTYEDYDVTHTRPSPSTLRLPTISSSKYSTTSPWRSSFNFIGAATRGMGWGQSDRGIPTTSAGSEQTNGSYSFEEWYGTSAATLQWKPSYNEIMLQHRSERVPRWNEVGNDSTTTPSGIKNSVTPTKEQLKQAVLHLYQSLDELESLKSMADDYRWEEMKEHLNPTPNTIAPIATSEYSLPLTLEYSMDILKSIPSSSAPTNDQAQSNSYSNNVNELPNLIGFDWGSCAWRHCGAKADAQEAIAELYSNAGMLEPFECRFILDVVERSIRDVLDVVPDEFKPHENGALVRLKPYEPYVSHGGGSDEDGMGIDYEYTKALSEVRIDLSME